MCILNTQENQRRALTALQVILQCPILYQEILRLLSSHYATWLFPKTHGKPLPCTVARILTSSSKCPQFTAEQTVTHIIKTQCLFSSCYCKSRHTLSLLWPVVEGRERTPPPREPQPDIWTWGTMLDCPCGITFSSVDGKQITPKLQLYLYRLNPK